jgi:putative membrane-bound dehydrogenase-like protein
MRFACRVFVLASAVVATVVAARIRAAEPTSRPASPLSPEEALKTFKIYPGFTIALAASEPLVQDPIAFNWGPDGRLWVVEMGDYPLGVDGKGGAGGRIKILEDTNGDLKYDKATLFLDGLYYPTGVTPWRKGVLVCCAPDIFYAEDTDGDGKCDKREVLFTGFGEGNQQHRLNGLVYGLDNWLYGANGDSNGEVKSAKTGKVVNISGRDFRLNPDTGEIDAVTGSTQFGRTRDDWGNWFGCNNSNPDYQFVLDDHYLRRNPHAAAPNPRHDVPEVAGPAPVYPISKTEARFNNPQSANHFTSACSLIFYRDELFGSGYRGNSFVSEPVHNLVHREVVWQDGVLVRSRRADDEGLMEFVASTDNWFRPTSLRIGPDGSMWIADMYRAVIEHPQWIPPETQARLDLRAGSDKGRIYRVWPPVKTLRPIPNLTKADVAGLVKSLESPGGWERDMAQQLLIERQDKSAVPMLEKLAGSSSRALARLQALCTLDGLDAVRPEVLIKATQDEIPGVRAHAVRLAEHRLEKSPELQSAIVALAKDPDATVRMQMAYSLGEWDDPRAGEALATIAMRDRDDPYIAAAVMSSVNEKNLPTVIGAVTAHPKKTPPVGVLGSLVRMAAATNNGAALAKAVDAVTRPTGPGDKIDRVKQFAGVAALLDGIEQGGDGGKSKELIGKLGHVLDAAREVAIDDAAKPDARAAAAPLLGRGLADEQAGDADLLAGMLTPQTPETVQAVAVASLTRITDPASAKAMISAWPALTPALRTQVLDALTRRPERVAALLDAIEAKKVLAADIDATRRRQLLKDADATIRARAEKVFAGAINPDRQKVIDQYKDALTLDGDAAKGKVFFTAVCATCHKVADVGVAVGPDLLSVADHSPDYYLLHVLDPNRAVEARYTNYIAQTKAGETFSGVLTGETGNSVTLTGAGGVPKTILRADLKRLVASPISVMPEGLEAGRTPQDFADLFAFLAGSGPPPLPKHFDGNKPALVKADPTTGVLKLTSETAQVYGQTLIWEHKHDNLGYWVSNDDHAVWSVDVPKAGKYDVVLNFACDPKAVGNTYVIASGKARVTGKVPDTGSWDYFRTEKVGRLELPAGLQRVTMRPLDNIDYALIDLKAIELVPAKN